MLVIHPTDKTTEMLSILYEGLGARLIEADCSNKEMGHLLHHTSPSERHAAWSWFRQMLVLSQER